MAENDQKTAKSEKNIPQEEVKEAEATPTSNFSFWRRFRPIFVVATIVLVECIVAVMLIPSGNQVFAGAELTPEQLETLQKATPLQNKEPEVKEPCIETDMGEYTITHSSQNEGTVTHISFHLYGVSTLSEQEELAPLLKEKENRIRDLVRSLVRETDISALADPSLALIKNQILEKVNRLLGKPFLREVVFSDYTFLER